MEVGGLARYEREKAISEGRGRGGEKEKKGGREDEPKDECKGWKR